MRSVFLGPRGLRVGWRLLVFIGLLAVLLGGAVLVGHGGLQGLRDAQMHMGEVTVTPFLMGSSEAITFALLCLATLVMARIEKRIKLQDRRFSLANLLTAAAFAGMLIFAVYLKHQAGWLGKGWATGVYVLCWCLSQPVYGFCGELGVQRHNRFAALSNFGIEEPWLESGCSESPSTRQLGG